MEMIPRAWAVSTPTTSTNHIYELCYSTDSNATSGLTTIGTSHTEKWNDSVRGITTDTVYIDDFSYTYTFVDEWEWLISGPQKRDMVTEIPKVINLKGFMMS